MKIYFAGSIRGGRQDAAFYKLLIDELKNYGKVLTEHVGSQEMNEPSSDLEIYMQDFEWLKKADILVAEVSQPSHGVGFEIGQAVAMNKRVVCLYRKKANVSAMLNGCPGVTGYVYSDVKEARKLLKKILES